MQTPGPTRPHLPVRWSALDLEIPDIFEFNEVWGNPNIALEKSLHNSFGVAHVFESLDLLVEATLFYKYAFSIAVPSDTLLLNSGRT